MFTRVAPDQYAVSVAVDGFEPRHMVMTIEPREVRVLSLPLDVARLNVTVRVTADVATLPATHSPSSTVLTKSRIERMPAFARRSLPDAIVVGARDDPGPRRFRSRARRRDRTESDHRWCRVLGEPARDVLGWRQPGHHRDRERDDRRVSGRGSGNRFGGVVDVATKSGLRLQDRGTATFSVGGSGWRQAAAEAGGRRGSVGYFFSGAALASNRFLSPPDRNAIHDAGDARHAFGRFTDWSGPRIGAINVVAIRATRPARKSRRRRRTWHCGRPRTPTRTHGSREQDTRLAGRARVVNERRRCDGVSALVAAAAVACGRSARRARIVTARRPDVRGEGRRDAYCRTARFQGRRRCHRASPGEDLDYDYSGYRDLTHLLALPHIHVANQRITFDGSERGGQVSAFAQDDIQLGGRLTGDFGVRIQESARAGHRRGAPEPARERGISGRTGCGDPRVVPRSLLRAAADRRRVVEQRRPDQPNQGHRRRASRAAPQATENQFELGGSMSSGLLQLNVTGYYRATDNPVHTTVWPDARDLIRMPASTEWEGHTVSKPEGTSTPSLVLA